MHKNIWNNNIISKVLHQWPVQCAACMETLQTIRQSSLCHYLKIVHDNLLSGNYVLVFKEIFAPECEVTQIGVYARERRLYKNWMPQHHSYYVHCGVHVLLVLRRSISQNPQQNLGPKNFQKNRETKPSWCMPWNILADGKLEPHQNKLAAVGITEQNFA